MPQVSDAVASTSGVAPPKPAPCRVLLAFPRFNPNSFWRLADTCDIAKAKSPAPPLGLLTLAALLPASWECRLVDCNVRDLGDADLDWADLVLTGGMLPQANDTVRILERCLTRGVPVCLGGPDATSRPEFYIGAGAELLVLGEAEGIIDTFVAAWESGVRRGRWDAAKFQADVTKSPVPRFDLVTFSDYLMMGVQFSRGCPFNCEFCDIIELYGRVPRTKTPAQMLVELDRLHALGYFGHVDFSDDNLIGNKKALKRFLPELIAWQKAHDYPFRFSTEASINLADDDDLLAMLGAANFFIVFIGIESGDTATLVSMQKKQNTRRSLADSVHKVYGAGMFVVAGFIVGFDTEKDAVTAEMIRCIEETSIPICIVGLLTALPNTQLSRRLAREGRLRDFDELPESSGDQCTAGLNFDTLRPRLDVLRDYKGVLERIYTPEAFFTRLGGVARHMRRPKIEAKLDWRLLRKNLAAFGRLGVQLLRRPRLLWPFLRFVVFCVKTNPAALEWLILNVAVYLHVGRFTEFVVSDVDRRIRELEVVPREPIEAVAA